jgi:hypothetical protein
MKGIPVALLLLALVAAASLQDIAAVAAGKTCTQPGRHCKISIGVVVYPSILDITREHAPAL